MNDLTKKEKGHVQVARKIKEMGLKQGDILVYAVIKDYKNGTDAEARTPILSSRRICPIPLDDTSINPIISLDRIG